MNVAEVEGANFSHALMAKANKNFFKIFAGAPINRRWICFVWGRTGCQPVLFGSLAEKLFEGSVAKCPSKRCAVVSKLPTTTGSPRRIRPVADWHLYSPRC